MQEEKIQRRFRNLHLIFKDFVKEQRPQVDTDVVATGEVWQKAKRLRSRTS